MTPDDLPLDPDLDTGRWPAIRLVALAAVFAGGFAGGLARDEVSRHWPTAAGTWPITIFGVNTGGAFLLAVILVLAIEVVPRAAYLRPTLGTGFCGAFTTFSSVATADDLLLAHGHAGVAVSYLVASLLAGLAAAFLGVTLARTIVVRSRR